MVHAVEHLRGDDDGLSLLLALLHDLFQSEADRSAEQPAHHIRQGTDALV